jgi:hypothetical protein
VHSTFWLRQHGRFCASETLAKKGSDHFLWLLTADIIIIDEISMLTAGALAAVDQALTFVMSNGSSVISASIRFGGKSLCTVGDLYRAHRMRFKPLNVTITLTKP